MSKLIANKNDLGTVSPDISKEWHETKNGNLKPSDVTKGSHKKVWWQCSKVKHHEWEATVKSRAISNNGCPFCANKKVSIENCLATISPDIAKEWHETKNGELTPNNVINGSGKKVWWQCSKVKHHEWEATIHSRTDITQQRGCPFCSGRSASIENCLATISPDIAKEWHETKNGDLKPSQVTNGSSKKVWWQCSRFKMHEWETTVNSRTGQNKTGCPFCSNQTSIPEVRFLSELDTIFETVISRKRVKGLEIDIYLPKISLGIEYDGIYFHKSKENQDLAKNKILNDEGIKLIRIREEPLKRISKFDIAINDKEVKKSDIDNLLKKILLLIKNEKDLTKNINSYLKKKNFQNNKQFKKYIACLPSPLYQNSLKYLQPKLSNEWHKTLNKPLLPEYFPEYSHIKIWWQCSKVKHHEWEARISDRSRGQGCPFCANKKVSIENCLATISPDIAKEWHETKNGELTSFDVTNGSHKKVWWQCSKVKSHEWEAVIKSRTDKKQKRGCPFCANKKVCIENCLATLSPKIAKEWHQTKNGKLTPFKIYNGSHKKVWWQCSKVKNHEWEARIKDRTREKKSTGCPHCYKNKYVEI